MTPIVTWYFVAISLTVPPGYIGPMTADQCTRVAAVVPALGICRQAIALQGCAVDGRPGIYTTCPQFAPLPEVTVKRQ